MPGENGDAVATSDAHEPLADEVVGVVVGKEGTAAVGELLDIMRGQRERYPQAVRGDEELTDEVAATWIGQAAGDPQAALLHGQCTDQGWPALDDKDGKRRENADRTAPTQIPKPLEHHCADTSSWLSHAC